jgi:hypothetical protein
LAQKKALVTGITLALALEAGAGARGWRFRRCTVQVVCINFFKIAKFGENLAARAARLATQKRP